MYQVVSAILVKLMIYFCLSPQSTDLVYTQKDVSMELNNHAILGKVPYKVSLWSFLIEKHPVILAMCILNSDKAFECIFLFTSVL